MPLVEGLRPFEVVMKVDVRFIYFTFLSFMSTCRHWVGIHNAAPNPYPVKPRGL
jgi:hypothetical protein